MPRGAASRPRTRSVSRSQSESGLEGQDNGGFAAENSGAQAGTRSGAGRGRVPSRRGRSEGSSSRGSKRRTSCG